MMNSADKRNNGKKFLQKEEEIQQNSVRLPETFRNRLAN
jgi:hypothetical protein